MRSLRARVLVTVSLVLMVCFGLTAFVLDLVFQHTAEQAIGDRLHVQVLALLSAADIDSAGRLQMPPALPEARFGTPGSGLYGRITDASGHALWHSGSSVGLTIPYPGPLPAGSTRLVRVRASDGTPVFALAMGVQWELADGSAHSFTVGVAESLEPYRQQLARYRRNLMLWFGGALVLLIAVQAATLRWLMRPLRRVEDEIARVEAGERSALGTDYPAELSGVADNLNALIRTERARLERYRESLGNLAHSLKTPLAVMRNALDRQPDRTPDPIPEEAAGHAPVQAPSGSTPLDEIRDQLDRIDAIVGYQLRRAAMSGGTTLGHAPLAVAEVAERIAASLRKLYAHKAPACSVEADADARFHGDEGDLMEILGNLLDNAFKWSRHRVRLRARALAGEHTRRPGLEIVVEDDGPGIAPDQIERLGERGVRSDESTPGHGIGLAVARELVLLHGGGIEYGTSELGGACFTLRIPPR